MANNLDLVLVKKPYQKESFTEQQIIELTKCLDPESGPDYFLRNFFYIQHPIRGKIQYVPYDYQVGLIKTYHNYRYSINMLARQMGKCLNKEVNITIKNKATNKIYDIPIGVFYEYQVALRNGKEYSIDQFERKS